MRRRVCLSMALARPCRLSVRPDRRLRALALDAPRRRGALALRRRLGVGLDVDVLLALVVGLDLDDVVVPRHRVERDAPRCAMA